MTPKPNIVTIMQTRRGSSRLPDKVLMCVAGKPLFVQQAERIMASALHGTLVIATTTDSSDDLIEYICSREGLNCYRGDPADLVDRHYKAALEYKADIAVKIPSDCPLISPEIIDSVLHYYLNNSNCYDFVSNLHPATYPDGNDVEVMTMQALKDAWLYAGRTFEREHTTPYIWEQPEKFRIGNVVMEGGENLSMVHRWTIDYREDFDFIKKVFDELYSANPLFSYKDILLLLEKRPDIYRINSQLAGVNWYRHHLDELKTISADKTKILEQ
ncbi:MAG TPA: glycosyltransferase family protein [Chitinophagaceae bacterium]|nr:glycosyltransferase family protein [Chitinophagaceae bacterium]